jgi:hypothetical protein
MKTEWGIIVIVKRIAVMYESVSATVFIVPPSQYFDF